jgi:hypothetical protein
MQLMLHSENEVSKFMMGHIEWSPTIGIWLSRRWLLKRVQQWMQGNGTPDPRNLIRDCYRLNIPDPWTVSYDTICIHVLMTNAEISRLAKDAPALRREHLLCLIEDAEEKSDTVQAQAILEILRREAQKKTWRKINYSTCPLVAPLLRASRLKRQPAQRHTGPRMRYSTSRHITYHFGFVTLSLHRYMPLLFYRRLALWGTQIVPRKYWTAHFLTPAIPTSRQFDFLRKLNTRIPCWGMNPSIQLSPFQISRVSGSVLTKISHRRSVAATMAITRQLASTPTCLLSMPRS